MPKNATMCAVSCLNIPDRTISGSSSGAGGRLKFTNFCSIPQGFLTPLIQPPGQVYSILAPGPSFWAPGFPRPLCAVWKESVRLREVVLEPTRPGSVTWCRCFGILFHSESRNHWKFPAYSKKPKQPRMYVCIYIYIYLSIYLPIYLSFYLSIISTYLSYTYIYTYRSIISNSNEKSINTPGIEPFTASRQCSIKPARKSSKIPDQMLPGASQELTQHRSLHLPIRLICPQKPEVSHSTQSNLWRSERLNGPWIVLIPAVSLNHLELRTRKKKLVVHASGSSARTASRYCSSAA